MDTDIKKEKPEIKVMPVNNAMDEKNTKVDDSLKNFHPNKGE